MSVAFCAPVFTMLCGHFVCHFVHKCTCRFERRFVHHFVHVMLADIGLHVESVVSHVETDVFTHRSVFFLVVFMSMARRYRGGTESLDMSVK